jgi:cell division protein FtsL
MMLRLVHLLVVASLVFAAADVYKIKFDSTLQAERVAKLRAEIRRERDAIAALRATWSELDNPERLQGLAQRHLALKPIETTQYDSFDRLPERPPQVVPPTEDPIAAIIDHDGDATLTGSIPAQARGR